MDFDRGPTDALETAWPFPSSGESGRSDSGGSPTVPQVCPFPSGAGYWLIRVFCLVILWAAGPLAAAGNETLPEFEQGNKLYEEGKYGEAVAAYEKLLNKGEVSPALYFNLGNALFKSGQPGRALVCYRRAEALSPRDPDIQANLQFLRKNINSSSVISGWRHRLFKLSLNEWAAIAMGVVWLWFVLLIIRELKPDLRPALSGYTATTGVAGGVLTLCLGLILSDFFHNTPAVVVVPEAVIRRGPLEESQSFYTLRNGSEVSVLDQKNDWLQVIDQAKRIGWVKRNQVVIVNPT
jgi:tetratricopeptide (TPR) repeat protein